MSSRFWTESPYSEGERTQRAEHERQPDQDAGKNRAQPPSPGFAQGSWINKPLSAEERARRANLTNAERQAEARAAREAYDRFEQESWYQKKARRSESCYHAAPPPPSQSSGNPNFFEGASTPKSERQQKQERKAEEKPKRRETRQNARDSSRRDQQHLKNMNRWEYLKTWWAKDREAYGNSFDEFSRSAEAFIQDNTKPFPTLGKHGCGRQNCVKGDKLGVCHHEVEMTLRGSGCVNEKMLKKERLRWHPDRWTGKAELQVKCNELFQLVQRIVDGDGSKA